MQNPEPFARPMVLAGALLLSCVFGSLHAFSALMLPLQVQYQSDRASVSFAYALAILCLTGGVFMSRWILPVLGARATALLCGLLGAAGLVGVARGNSLAVLWLGYGVVFGGVNGVAYSLFLDRAAAALPAPLLDLSFDCVLRCERQPTASTLSIEASGLSGTPRF